MKWIECRHSSRSSFYSNYGKNDAAVIPCFTRITCGVCAAFKMICKSHKFLIIIFSVCVCFVGVVVVVVGEQKGGISIVASSFFSHISLPFIREAAKENDVLKTADA